VPKDYDVSSAVPCLFIHVIYAISLSLYPFTERYAQPYFFSCLIRQVRFAGEVIGEGIGRKGKEAHHQAVMESLMNLAGEWGYVRSGIDHYAYSYGELARIRRFFFAGYGV
nr:hypothetical protein [Tanacetum cinerariifolium]